MNLGPYTLFDVVEQNKKAFFQICAITLDIKEPLNHSVIREYRWFCFEYFNKSFTLSLA